jgi:nitroreductase/FMN reductase [NAD(P)H]
VTGPGHIHAAVAARFGDASGLPEGDTQLAGVAPLLDRRSCRDYAARAVPDAVVRLLLAAGLSAPTKSDLQQADVVWVKDDRLRSELLEGIGGADWIAKAPVFLVVCGNGARLASLFEDGEFPNDHFDALFNAIGDAAIVMEGIVAAAAIAGLATCPISQLRNRAGRIARLLDLPDRVFPFAGLCIGYAAAPGRISPRLDMGITVHEDRYDRGAFARLGAGYDARRLAADPAAKHAWSAAKRHQYTTPQRADFGAWLREIGFSFD